MRTGAESWTALTCGVLVVGTLLACKKKKEETPTTAPAATAAPTATTALPPATSDKLHNVGDTALANDYKFTVENIKECKVKYYFKPKKGNIKLGAEVLIEGTGDKQIPINPFYAKVIDSEGFSYTSTFAGCEPELKSLQVSKGEKSRGWITFEVPEKATGLKLTYSPFVIGAKQEVKFDLGR